MYFESRKSHVGHHNAVEVEEAGHAVRFQKKKAAAAARANKKKGGQK
jgi:PiT family inorganic phosphate transporter